MANASATDTTTPIAIVNTATPPWWFGTFAMLGLVALSLFGLWLQAQNPIFGVPLTDPAALVAAGFIVLVGAFGIVSVWLQSAEAWRKVPDGPLSPEVCQLADAGRTTDAMVQLHRETGAGLCEARQVIDLYLAQRAARSPV